MFPSNFTCIDARSTIFVQNTKSPSQFVFSSYAIYLRVQRDIRPNRRDKGSVAPHNTEIHI